MASPPQLRRQRGGKQAGELEAGAVVQGNGEDVVRSEPRDVGCGAGLLRAGARRGRRPFKVGRDTDALRSKG